VISGLVIERVVIANTLTRAISLGTTAGATAPSRARYGMSIGHTLVITATVRDCRFANILGNPSESELYVAPGSTTVMVEGTYFQILGCPGARMSESRGVKLLSCVFEDAGTYAPSFVYLGGQNFNISVDGCWFEKHGGGGLVPFVYCYHRNHGITLRDSHFVRTYSDSSHGTLAGTMITVRGDQYVGVLGTSGVHAYTPRLNQTTLALISGCTAYTNNAIPSDTTCVFVSPDDDATLDVVTIENSYCSSVDIINSSVALEARTRAMSGCVPTGFTLANHINRPSVVGL